MATEILLVLVTVWLAGNLLFAGLLVLRARARPARRPHLRLVHSQESVPLAAHDDRSFRRRRAVR